MRNLVWVMALVLLGCRPNKNSPEYISKQFLLALQNKDWNNAKVFGDQEIDQYIEMLRENGSEIEINEVKDIKCKQFFGTAECFYCCSSESWFSKVNLKKNEEGTWEVIMPKDGGCAMCKD